MTEPTQPVQPSQAPADPPPPDAAPEPTIVEAPASPPAPEPAAAPGPPPAPEPTERSPEPASEPEAGAAPTPPVEPAPTSPVEPAFVPAVQPAPAPPAVPPPPAGSGAVPPPGPRPPIYSMITTFDESVSMSRLWGIPLIGVMIRGLLLIPHYIVLFFYAIVVAVLQLVMWIPVLVNGSYPGWGYSIVGGYVRWVTRVQAYLILAAAAYPPLSTRGRHDVDVRWDEAQSVPRWAGIPFLGVWLRSILLIPHVIILFFLGFAVGLLSLITWIPVLLTGRYAGWAYEIVGGYIRWQNRLTCYLLLMTGPYPPFSLND